MVLDNDAAVNPVAETPQNVSEIATRILLGYIARVRARETRL